MVWALMLHNYNVLYLNVAAKLILAKGHVMYQFCDYVTTVSWSLAVYLLKVQSISLPSFPLPHTPLEKSWWLTSGSSLYCLWFMCVEKWRKELENCFLIKEAFHPEYEITHIIENLEINHYRSRVFTIRHSLAIFRMHYFNGYNFFICWDIHVILLRFFFHDQCNFFQIIFIYIFF